MKWLVVLAAACSQPVSRCADELAGPWLAPDGNHWMFLDNRATLEAYPMFDDAVPDGAPRVIELRREATRLAGEVHRRFARRAEACDARAPIRITRCADDALELVIGDPAPPAAFAPCVWLAPDPSRVERWKR